MNSAVVEPTPSLEELQTSSEARTGIVDASELASTAAIVLRLRLNFELATPDLVIVLRRLTI